ncbi:MAG: hypothetical protein IKL76_03430, partial [Clostridia bacterium]|nr:hypothetical protein [Clostridia bacterium]
GLSAMAKKRGLKKRWLAFIPFANIWYIGKIAGECNVFGQRMKRGGLYTMLAQIFTTVLCGLTIAVQVYLLVVEGAPEYDQFGFPFWINLTGFSAVAYKFYGISQYILPIFQLVYEVFMLILLIALYKRYAHRNYFILSMLALFVPVSRFIVIFVLRNRNGIDYEAYMRARHEAYMRQQQQYGGYNPYYGGYNRNPYGNPYNNPYGNPQNAPKPPEDPFGEFGNASTQNDTNAQSTGAPSQPDPNDPDGFFD